MKNTKLEQYQKECKLGQGTYGIVYKAKDKNTGQLYALKKIRLQSQDEGIPSTAIREISILRQLNHPNIVKLQDVIHNNKKLVLVFQYVDYDLKKFLSNFRQKGIDSKTIKILCYQLLKGVQVCHKNKILHRDLKPQNLLISNQKILKIADFGLARASGIPVKSFTHEVVTLWYRPPDVLLGSQKYTCSIDIWSVGCIFAQMCNLKPMFPGSQEQDQLNKIFEVIGTPTVQKWPELANLPNWKQGSFINYESKDLHDLVPNLDQEGINLLKRMLKANPNQRITATQALKHSYFKDVVDQLEYLYKK